MKPLLNWMSQLRTKHIFDVLAGGAESSWPENENHTCVRTHTLLSSQWRIKVLSIVNIK